MVTYREYRPGRWVKVVDGEMVGPATLEEVAAWREAQARANATARELPLFAEVAQGDAGATAPKRPTRAKRKKAPEQPPEPGPAKEDNKEKQARPAYIVYRPGDRKPDGKKRGPKELEPEAVLAEALAVYQQLFKGKPKGIACHPTWVEAVKAALADRGDGYNGVEVVEVGGCLVPEIWLEVPDEPR